MSILYLPWLVLCCFGSASKTLWLKLESSESSEWIHGEPRGAPRCRPGSAGPLRVGAKTSHRVSQLSISHSPKLQHHKPMPAP